MKSIIKRAEKNKKAGRIFLFIFFSIFAAVGGGMLYPLGIRPIMKTFDAESWETVPCKILSARVESHTGDDSNTYSVEIEYSYQYNGKPYPGDQYTFMGGSSSGYKGKQKVVTQYKKANNPVCFVNPDNPAESVLKRGFHLGLLLALLPLPFAAVGFGGLYWIIFRFGKKKALPTRKKWLPKYGQSDSTESSYENPYQVDSVEDFTYADSGMIEIKATSPFKALLGIVAFAAFWNGIVSVFVVQLFNGFEWFLALFLIPFVLVGLGLIGAVVYFFLKLFNPRPRVMLSTANAKPGDQVKMQWQFSGRTLILKNLNITLRAIEKATYRRGTDTVTAKNTFFQKELKSTEDTYQISCGEFFFAIPDNAMHSFDAQNNKIEWEIALTGQIDSWPDVDQTYKITVLP